MKYIKLLVALFTVAFSLSSALAWRHGAPSAALSLARSQFGPNFLQSFTTEYPLTNLFKGTPNWVYGNGSGTPKPDELDVNGYLLSGANWTTQSGANKLFTIPLLAENPGDYVLLWLGQGKFSYYPNGFGVTTSTCSGGAKTGTTIPSCDNTACSTFTGSIAPGVGGINGVLTVTAAPTGTSCTLSIGLPVSGQVAQFDTMTVITGNASTSSSLCSPACTGAGGTGTYAVNISQTQASGTMVMGARFQIAFGSSVGYVGSTPSNAVQLQLNALQTATGSGVQRVTNVAAFNATDEPSYQTSHKPCGNGKACIVSTAFKTRMQQGNFAVFRDLNWGQGNTGNCTTWSCRKPITSHSYGANELRNAASGNETYTAQGQTYTIPKIGQYVNAAGTGASGGTISYAVDTYSITLGSGAPVDKQIITALMPAAGTTSSQINLNATGNVPLLAPYGGPLTASFTPVSGEVATMVYDAVIGGFLYFTPHNANSARGLDAGVPPEVTMEVIAELGMADWHVPPYLSQDPATDWVTQHATWQKNNYTFSNLHLANLRGPIYEPQNEPFNCIQFNAAYMGYKSAKYHNTDPVAWPSGGYGCGPANSDNYAWMGKAVSTSGQDLNSVYGAGNYELTVAVQTTYPPGSQLYPALTSRQYVAQTLIPAQTGYTQTAAYLYATRVSNDNYWNPGVYCGGGDSGAGPCDLSKQNGFLGLEAGYAYCYFYYTTSTACQSTYASQAAAMTAYMNTSLTTPCGNNIANCKNLTGSINYVSGWATQALTCFNGASRPANCTVDQTRPIFMYEGTFSMLKLNNDLYNTFTTAQNTSPGIVNIAANGCVPGQTVQLSALTGGTWSTAAGSYVVDASGTDSSHCALTGLNATGLGTLTGGRLTYTGSQAYINVLRQYAYLSPDLDTLTTTLYTGLVAAGAQNPSQFNFNDNGPYFDSPWLIGSSIYSSIQTAICQGCSIAGSTLTLGGTISMVFRTGDILYGTGVTGPGAGSSVNTILGACTPIGANVCGTTAGDTFALNQASTVASTRMTTVAPAFSTAWTSIRAWNGNP